MTDAEKRAHDIAIAVIHKNLMPLVDGDDFNKYMSSILSLYFDAFSSAKTILKDR